MGFDIAGAAGSFTLTSPSGTTLSLDGTVANVVTVNASGILTRTQTPIMMGAISGQGTPYNGGGGALRVVAVTNFGGCWNNATGLWTCPVAGDYMVTMGGIASAGSGYPRIRKNGADVNYTHWNSGGNWHYCTLSAILRCAAGDTIHFAIASPNPATAGFYGNGGHGMYSIALMA